MAGDMVFTSESVTEGHPDKIADQICRIRFWTRQRRVELAQPRQHRRGGHDRVHARVRPRPVRGAPVHRRLGPHEPLVGDHDLAVVGSVTIAASARTDASTSCTPRLACSSSATAATTTSPPDRARPPHGTPAAPPRRPPSCRRRRARRADRRPPAATNGSAIPSTPTVSRCPHSSSVRPPPRARRADDARSAAGVPRSARPPAPAPRPRRDERGDLALPRTALRPATG